MIVSSQFLQNPGKLEPDKLVACLKIFLVRKVCIMCYPWCFYHIFSNLLFNVTLQFWYEYQQILVSYYVVHPQGCTLGNSMFAK